jgi:protein-tyrosine-phosphatase
VTRTVERVLVGVARRLESRAETVLRRPWLRTRMRHRALRAWRGTDAPLIACYGNINRSPFAAALARHRGRPGAWDGGFHPQHGRPAPAATIACAAAHGVDLADHRSRLLTRDDLTAAPAIFVFDLQNVARVAARNPTALARTHLLGALDNDPRVLIADPEGRPAAVVEQTVARIAQAVDRAEASR